MLKDDRLNKIVNLVNFSNKELSVGEICLEVGSSLATVRKNLTFLNNEGYLIRTHGGAKKIDKSFYNFDSASGIDEKTKKISRKLSEIIKNNMAVVLDKGSYEFFHEDFFDNYDNISIICLSLDITMQLIKNYRCKIIFPGGKIQRDLLTASNYIAEKNLKRLYSDKFILCNVAVSISKGITCSSFEEANIKKIAINNSKETILLTHSINLEEYLPVKIGPITLINRIIISSNISRNVLEKLEKMNIEVIKV